MTEKRNVGPEVPGWQPVEAPAAVPLEGAYVRLEPLDPDSHATDLHRAFAGHDWLWDYLPYGPFTSAGAYHRWAREKAGGTDPLFLVLRAKETGHCGGIASFLRINPEMGSIEIGHICIAPELQRTATATEALFLMMDWAFRAGYRRCEWKCDTLNMGSRRAAQRLGFRYEGLFRQAAVVKGRNRDTAWFSIIDSEWPALADAYGIWLSPGNLESGGTQRERLSDLTRLAGRDADPVPAG